MQGQRGHVPKTQTRARSEIVDFWRMSRPRDREPTRDDMEMFCDQIPSRLPAALDFRTLREHRVVILEWLQWEEIAAAGRMRQTRK